MQTTEINRIYNNKFYSSTELGIIAFRAMSNEKMTEEESILKECLRRGLYDSMYDEQGEIGIKINLDKVPVLDQTQQSAKKEC